MFIIYNEGKSASQVMKEYKKREELNGSFKNLEGNIWVSFWYDDEIDTYCVIVSKKKLEHLDSKDVCYHAKEIADFDRAIQRYKEAKIIIES